MSLSAFSYTACIPEVVAIARQAAAAITEIYNSGKYDIQHKSDSSPITAADKRAHEILVGALGALDPSIPILSEEGGALEYLERKRWDRHWLIDPLDGTREFIARSGEFTVNIALIEDHRPVLGVIIAPISQECYWAVRGHGAYRQGYGADPSPLNAGLSEVRDRSLKVVVSRRFQETEQLQAVVQNSALRKKYPNYDLIYCGSALKICWVACGLADLYPRFGATSEWDTAAGQCILEETKGSLVDFFNRPLRYNERTTLVNPGFFAIAAGVRDLLFS